MLHVISTQCVAHDLHMITPWPLERTYWRQFATQWGGCKDLELCLLMRSSLLPLLLLSSSSSSLLFPLSLFVFLVLFHFNMSMDLVQSTESISNSSILPLRIMYSYFHYHHHYYSFCSWFCSSSCASFSSGYQCCCCYTCMRVCSGPNLHLKRLAYRSLPTIHTQNNFTDQWLSCNRALH